MQNKVESTATRMVREKQENMAESMATREKQEMEAEDVKQEKKQQVKS